ncbi:hypothetical protein BT96DRAFT_913972 [Gymnopus androsaceus JB14]|uniref:Uncharacterized protein n=1 Tax=Gymnopus androsaceus JB14 TaxID=1447944 RepID=A0A6A4II99_9AGAR|nr:hypothetical protein BT96DRAFT_913972 [Gymnopus androsaceus JB14]
MPVTVSVYSSSPNSNKHPDSIPVTVPKHIRLQTQIRLPLSKDGKKTKGSRRKVTYMTTKQRDKGARLLSSIVFVSEI